MSLIGFKRFWSHWRNKILALIFIGLAFLLYGSYYIYLEIASGWRYFVSEPFEIWNVFIYFVVYFVILYGNAKNNDIAYTGILMFVCMLVLECITHILESFQNGTIFFLFSAAGVYYLFTLALEIAEIIIGVYYYVGIQKYLTFRSDNFKKLRVLGIIFASLLFINRLPILLLLIFSYSYGSIYLLLTFALPFSELFTSIANIFTVERLKR